MTREQAVEELRKLIPADADEALGRDVEADHSRADDILCQLLLTLGYTDVVMHWQQVEKWYA